MWEPRVLLISASLALSTFASQIQDMFVEGMDENPYMTPHQVAERAAPEILSERSCHLGLAPGEEQR